MFTVRAWFKGCSNRSRVLFVDFITTFGGVQRVMANMIPELAKWADVTYIDALEDSASRAVFECVGVPLARLQMWPRRQVLGFEGSLLHKLRVLVTWGPAHMLYAVRLAAYAKRNGFQVIYTNSKKGLMVCMVAGRLARLPVVYHCHGLECPEDVGTAYRAAMRACGAVIAVSQDVKRKLVMAGIPGDLIHVVYNGVNVGELEAASSRGSDDMVDIATVLSPKCLVACNLQKGKGVHVAIEAVNVLRESGHLVHLLIAGDVPRGGDIQYRDRLHEMVQVSGLQDQVHFLGWRSDLPAIMKMCDILLVPSIAGWESFGMVAAEAMALGKPVIASRIGGLPEVVQDGQVGYLFEPGDANELADRIWRLISNTSLYERLSCQARQWVNTQFTVQRQARDIAWIVGKVINGSGHGALQG